jgi:hypothetical protein
MSISKIYPDVRSTITGLFGDLSFPLAFVVWWKSSWMTDYLFLGHAHPEWAWGNFVGSWIIIGSVLLIIPACFRTRYDKGFWYMAEVMFVYIVCCVLFALILIGKPIALTVFDKQTLQHITGGLILFTGASCRYLSTK